MEDKIRPVTWVELVERTAARANLPKSHVEKVLEAFLGTTRDAITHLEPVRLKGLGTFSAEWTKERVLRSPHDQRKMYLDGRYQVRFKASDIFRKALVERSPQLWRSQDHQHAWRMAETLISDLELYHQKQIPTLPAGLALDEVFERVSSSLGSHWRKVLLAYEEAVPVAVRLAKNHLIETVKMRWTAQDEAK